MVGMFSSSAKRVWAISKQLNQPSSDPADIYASALKSKLTPNEQVICKDFAELSRDIFKALGFNTATFIINTGIEHTGVMAQDPKTGMMYIITADGAWGMWGKVFQAKNEGVPITGYLVWSLTDNFEWTEGFEPRFGLVYVDYNTRKRYMKDSGKWFRINLGLWIRMF